MIKDILIEGEGTCFYRFANADGKVWIMPARHLRTAMELYQPSGSRGKMLKRWLPLLHQIPLVRQAIHIETLRCRLSDELRQVLEGVFSTGSLDIAIFCGTPSRHRKVTMQISKEGRILGYVKIADNGEVAALFDKEARLLNVLKEKGMERVPEALYCGSYDAGMTLFVQSTTKTIQSRVVHDWREMHEQFLMNMREATTQLLKFEDSDYCRTLIGLCEHLDWLPPVVDKALVRRAVGRICNRWEGKVVAFSAYHADFTPWNMFVEKGNLFVFDWEYAQMTYPPMLDRYHFFTQTAIFEHHWRADDIIRYIGSGEGAWVDADDYMAYLIDVIARFTIREQGNVRGDMASSMKLWGELLSFVFDRRFFAMAEFKRAWLCSSGLTKTFLDSKQK